MIAAADLGLILGLTLTLILGFLLGLTLLLGLLLMLGLTLMLGLLLMLGLMLGLTLTLGLGSTLGLALVSMLMMAITWAQILDHNLRVILHLAAEALLEAGKMLLRCKADEARPALRSKGEADGDPLTMLIFEPLSEGRAVRDAVDEELLAFRSGLSDVRWASQVLSARAASAGARSLGRSGIIITVGVESLLGDRGESLD